MGDRLPGDDRSDHCLPVSRPAGTSGLSCTVFSWESASPKDVASCGAGCLVVAGLTTYLLFPETSGIPVETTHTVFKDHWAWPRMYPEILQVSM